MQMLNTLGKFYCFIIHHNIRPQTQNQTIPAPFIYTFLQCHAGPLSTPTFPSPPSLRVSGKKDVGSPPNGPD